MYVIRKLLLVSLLVSLVHSEGLSAQLNENCVVSVLNRTVQVKPDGTWVLPNIPANFGPVRARATCVENGVTRSGQSALFTLPPNGSVDVPRIVLGPVTPIPTALEVSAATTTLNTPGQTVPLNVTGTYADGNTANLTAGSTGTQYLISNAALATITADGIVTARQSGTVLVQAVHEGAQGLLQLTVALSRDSDGDGIPDDVELQWGLDPNNHIDGRDDLDRDGLTNFEEYQRGTNPRLADSDGDGVSDGDEVKIYGTNPLLADTDGDGVPDGVEVASGSDPRNPASTNLANALSRITVTPANFVINVNSIEGVGFQQLNVIGQFKLGGTINLTARARGTNYASDNLSVCNFGAEDGRVFGGGEGVCTITVTSAGFTATAIGTVRGFSPQPLSFVAIPGFANNVDVSGNYAYVAAGATGLQIVDVTNRASPAVVASMETPGNANDVVVVGNFAYVADGPFGLRIANVTNPLAPTLAGAYDTPGDAWDVVVRGGLAFIADGSGGLQIINVTNPAAPSLVGSLALPGTAKGVDVDLQRNIAVVAAGSSGIHVVNIANRSAPALLGSLGGGDVRDVVVRGNFAYLADFSRSLTVVDISNPTVPSIMASTPSSVGGLLQDVAVSGNFAVGADVFFVNGVPIIDVSNPASPQPRAILNFGSFRDDNATGIAVDNAFIYLTAERGISENGTIGDTRLYIGQYLSVEDRAGVPPSVTIVSPANGSTVIQGTQLPISIQATDDVGVAAVNFVVNGSVMSTDTSSPYEFSFAVPTTATTINLGAQAIDYGGNVANSAQVTINAIPDPLTTISGRILRQGSLVPVSGASVTCLARTTTSGADGSFSIAGAPTIMGDVTCRATIVQAGKTLRGSSPAKAPVPAGVTAMGDIVIKEGSRVLLLSDSMTPGTVALADALTRQGSDVVVRDPPEFTWDGTNPPLTDFGCVVHLDGATWFTPLPQGGQQALVDFVRAGGGYITHQWIGYERTQRITTGMDELILFGWGGADGGENCGGCIASYVAVPEHAAHPILAGLPNSFSFMASANSAGALFDFAADQPVVVMKQGMSGRPAVAVRQVGAGRAVQFSHAPNYYDEVGLGGQELLDPNIQQLSANSVAWACR